MSLSVKSRGATKVPRKMIGVTADQIALVQVAKRECSLSEGHYQALIVSVAGVSSSKDLSQASFQKVLDRLTTIGFAYAPAVAKHVALPTTATSSAPGNRAGMATDAHIDLVRQLWAKWHGKADERALNRWIECRFGVSSNRFATVQTAQMAIEGLKVMTSRRVASHCAKTDEHTSRD